jgi:L,D-transpeptidase YcbB
MKVVVGKAYHHQTPVFAANMNQVVFRPYWNVPSSIQRAELVPKIERDPSYLAKNRYEVVTFEDTVVTSGIVDAATLADLRSGKLRIRQTPGPENSLGLVKFLFPNEHEVYLHATPAMELFSNSRRDFSHGCIRVEKPRQLAAWVLRNQPEWTPEHIAEAMNGGKTIAVTLDRPIPVLIVYATAVVLQSGEVRFFEDIYGLDAQLAETLAGGPTSGERGPHPRE